MKDIPNLEFLESLRKTKAGLDYLDLVNSVLLENRGTKKQKGFERHHIHPRALGGQDTGENLIKLTVLEHCKAHALLAKALPCYETLVPISKMTFGQIKKLTDLEKIELDQVYEWAELREKSCEARRGRHLTEEHKQKLREWRLNSGFKLSEEARLKISKANKGRKHTEEEKRKVSEALKGGNSTSWKKGQTAWNKGKKVSEEWRKHNSEAHKGKHYSHRLPMSEEHRRKLSEAHKGKVLSEETKRKISEAHRKSGKYVNEKYSENNAT